MAEAPEFLEQHYRLNQLAKAWGYSVPVLRKWFENEPSVVRHGEKRLRKGRKKAYVSLRIPESTARRVYLEHTRTDDEGT